MSKINYFLSAVFLGIFFHNAHAEAGHQSKFSISPSIGFTSFKARMCHDFTASEGGVFNNDIGGYSPIFGLSIEYGWFPSDGGIYLGAEIFTQYENINVDNKISDIETNIRDNSSFGACLKAGHVYKDMLFYVKSGVVSMGDFKKGLSIRKKGMIIGIGIEHILSKNWSVGAEFDYERFTSIEGSIPEYVTIRYEPRKFTSNLKLKYTF